MMLKYKNRRWSPTLHMKVSFPISIYTSDPPVLLLEERERERETKLSVTVFFLRMVFPFLLEQIMNTLKLISNIFLSRRRSETDSQIPLK